ncbi:hypothetical protein ELI02_29985 (plasmid) [Rhizobium leguminosarum]|uniref:hypothetical protein n=1 Tax=Rhizobium leguminosarum TaxID=384 RepID=UPI00102FEF23|nr:hypothetical protein [Rhizobium leguminosarum]TAV48430.1 hypothetical protein ELI32_09470 [Rhizobium leguminosarum]TAV57930.1 hypothetical protein ELI31_09000 [Rhizobium leguminosarum]TAV68871.1 hypothetical protein ELI30_09015 [Rhizobium leguminosarum]TAX45945.1 hypothetical protein ELI02_29985 [Rhizobium leguminosarum]
MIWMQAGQLITTMVIGVIAALIAWRQWRTARDKIKLDLFDRRFAVFMDVRKLCSEATQVREFSDPSLRNELVARSRFLFGPEIHAQISKLYDLCVRVEMNDHAARDEIDSLFKQFIQSVKPYMHFGDIKS